MKLDEGYYQNLKEGKKNYYSDNFPKFLEDKKFQDSIDFDTSIKDLQSYNTTEQRILVSNMYRMKQNSNNQKIYSFMATLLSQSSRSYGIGLARVYNDLYESEKMEELTKSSTEATFVAAPDYKTTKSELKMIEGRKLTFDKKLKSRMCSIKSLSKYIIENAVEIYNYIVDTIPGIGIDFETGTYHIFGGYEIADKACKKIIDMAANNMKESVYPGNIKKFEERLSKYRGL